MNAIKPTEGNVPPPYTSTAPTAPAAPANAPPGGNAPKTNIKNQGTIDNNRYFLQN